MVGDQGHQGQHTKRPLNTTAVFFMQINFGVCRTCDHSCRLLFVCVRSMYTCMCVRQWIHVCVYVPCENRLCQHLEHITVLWSHVADMWVLKWQGAVFPTLQLLVKSSPPASLAFWTGPMTSSQGWGGPLVFFIIWVYYILSYISAPSYWSRCWSLGIRLKYKRWFCGENI